jgi:hypothetical protein
MRKKKFEFPNFAKLDFELNHLFTYDKVNLSIYDVNTISIITGLSRTCIIHKVKECVSKNETIIIFYHKTDKKAKLYPLKLKFVFLRGRLLFVKVYESIECQYERRQVSFSDYNRVINQNR